MKRLPCLLPACCIVVCTVGLFTSCQRHFETQVIVGATLLDGVHAPVQYSVIVIRDGKIASIGPQQTVPVPVDSDKFNGTGKFVTGFPPSAHLLPGAPANLAVFSSDPRLDHSSHVERMMHDGAWIAKD